jgi:tRNA modification GTPase
MDIATNMGVNLGTIAAIATAPGRGGVGVVRVSGKDLSAIIAGVVGLPSGKELVPRCAQFATFTAADGTAMDSGLALLFPAPGSYTGETVLELQGHGGPVIMRMLLQRVLDLGARLAEPGEFTRRAYLNGKLDLAQAEGVADLIEAATESAARAATRSLQGAFSQAVRTLVDRVIHLRMLVEATLDFPEEDIDFLQAANARGQLTDIRTALEATLAQATQGALLRDGMTVVLAGRPNVGKSSLLNALAGEEVAIVTPIAGTTRDRVQTTVALEGVPVHVVDTAGLRDATDQVEQIGIERTWAAVEKADVVLRLKDIREPNTADDAAIDAEIAKRIPESVPRLVVLNKRDLADNAAVQTLAADGSSLCSDAVQVSAKTQLGLDALKARLLQLVSFNASAETTFSARERHVRALRQARDHLNQAANEAGSPRPALEIFAEELRLAQDALNTITGEFTPDDLLGEIFGKFCIGK